MSLDIFSAYATDENLENHGSWFKLGGDARVLVARTGNRAYAKSLTKHVELQRATLDLGGDAAEAASDQIMVEVIAESILLGWENISFKGADLPYSIENAKTVLAVKDFRKVIVGFADSSEAYKAKLEADQGKA